MPYSVQCLMCIHYRMDLKCAAFPDRIPEEIFTGIRDHRRPYPGDKGLRYSPVETAGSSTVKAR